MRFILLALYVSFICCFHAQQTPQYTQWNYHQLALNPALSGVKQCIELKFQYRRQWAGIDGAPVSGVTTFSFPINFKRKTYLQARHGLAFRYDYDHIGPFLTNRFNLGYAMHINFDQIRRISFGVFAGIRQFSFNRDNITTIDPDPAVANYTSNLMAPDATLGLFYNDKNYYIGFTMQELFQNKWKRVGTKSKYQFFPTFNAGYKWTLNESWSLLPCFLIKLPYRAPTSIDLQLFADWNNKLAFGVAYRNVEGFQFLMQIKAFKKVSLGYSLDLNITKLGGARQTHEIMLSYSGCLDRSKASLACPVFE